MLCWCIRDDIRKARDDLRAARMSLSRDASLPVASRLWTRKQAEFCGRVTDVNVKVDRLNMIVPTLYQQIARFDASSEQKAIIEQCSHLQQTQSSVCHQQQQRCHTDTSSLQTFTDVLKQLKALFTA